MKQGRRRVFLFKKDSDVWEAELRKGGEQVRVWHTGETDRARAADAARVEFALRPNAAVQTREGMISKRKRGNPWRASKPGPKPNGKRRRVEREAPDSPLAMFRQYVEAEVRARVSEKIDDLIAILESWRGEV